MSLELQSLLPYPNSCLGTGPHQQGRDTKMLSFCGIDVSKDRLNVMVLPEEQCCSVPNDARGWAALVERLRNFSIMAIGLEASGGYERGVARALLAAGMSVHQVTGQKRRLANFSPHCLSRGRRMRADRQLPHPRALAFAQGREQHDPPVREFQRIVMDHQNGSGPITSPPACIRARIVKAGSKSLSLLAFGTRVFALDGKKLAAFSALGGGFLRFPIG